MHDHEYWVRIAEEDRMAFQSLCASNGPWRIVVFLASSAAEKYLKAFLAFMDRDPDRTHDMNKLLDECRTFDPSLVEFVSDCGHLSLFSVDSRYPEYEGDYDENSAMLAIAASDRICDALRNRMS